MQASKSLSKSLVIAYYKWTMHGFQLPIHRQGEASHGTPPQTHQGHCEVGASVALLISLSRQDSLSVGTEAVKWSLMC